MNGYVFLILWATHMYLTAKRYVKYLSQDIITLKRTRMKIQSQKKKVERIYLACYSILEI